jgi:hypothetical protein
MLMPVQKNSFTHLRVILLLMLLPDDGMIGRLAAQVLEEAAPRFFGFEASIMQIERWC